MTTTTGTPCAAALVPTQRARPFHVRSMPVPRGICLRALTAHDLEHMVALFERLSPRSRYLRYLAPIQNLSRHFLKALADIDHHDRDVVGAFASDALIGMARYVRYERGSTWAEVSVEVADDFQRRGVGERLVRELALRARERGIEQLTASGLRENHRVLSLLRRLEWPAEIQFDGPEFNATICLAAMG